MDVVDGESSAGGFNCLDSAGGGSFELDMYQTLAAATPPPASFGADRSGNGDEASDDEDDEASTNDTTSDGFDSGFETIAATPRDGGSGGVGAMTELEIVAAAEATMRSAQKAAAGTVARTPMASGLPPNTAAAAAMGGGAGGVVGGGVGSGADVARDHDAGEECPPATEGEKGDVSRRAVS